MEAITSAAKAGDRQGVEASFASVPASERSLALETVACAAAEAGNVPLLDWAFTQGFALRPASDCLNDPFFWAAVWGGHVPVLAYLVDERGLSLSAQYSESSGEALDVAAAEGNVELARWLLDRGASPDSRGSVFEGWTAVVNAVAGRAASMDMLRLLVERGATVRGTGVFVAAAERGNIPALEYLGPREDVDLEEAVTWWGYPTDEAKDETGSALYRAVLKGQYDAAEFLLEHGASKGAKDRKGRDCVDIAKEVGNEEMLELLDCYAP